MPRFEILFLDEHFAIISKAPNLICHHSHYARNVTETSLAQLLNTHFEQDIHLVNRLDRKTSGIVVVGFNPEITSKLQKLNEKFKWKKSYVALVRGWPDKKMIINSPIKNDESGKYQSALSHLQLLESVTYEKAVTPYPTSRYSLVSLEPKTGRTHQLRKHMNKIAHPIIGDPKHGNRHHNHAFQDWFNNSNLFLHAQHICFEHPETNEMIKVEAALPAFWIEILAKLGFKLTFGNNQK